MNAVERTLLDLDRLDRLSAGDSFVHRLDPRAKLLATLVFLLCVVSFSRYELSALLPFALFPVVLAAQAGLPAGFLLRRLLLVAPLAVLVGLFNPLLDRQPLLALGPVVLSGGWVSWGSILLRFVLTVGAALVLVATTPFAGICRGLERLGMPRVLAVQLLLTHRYLFVLGAEAARLVRARSLRSSGRRGLGLRTFGSLVGQLLLRSLDRAQRLHGAMRCRGFTGEIRCRAAFRFRGTDLVFVLGWSALFVLLRRFDLPQLLGSGLLALLR